MEIDDEIVVPCSPEDLAPWIEDLGRYPQWMGLVHRADPLDDRSAPCDAWQVELRARLGPLARSKRLRMIRTVHESPGLIRFERQELDDRHHGRWVLSASYGPVAAEGAGPATRLLVTLSYEGKLWTAGLLERALHDEIARSKQRLVELVTAAPTR